MKFKPSFNKYIVTQTPSEENKNFEDDYVVKTIGAFGPWQAIVFIITTCLRFIVMVNCMSIIFLTPTTEFTCVRFKDGIYIDVQNSTCYDDCVEYTYHDTVFVDTLISRFDLICKNKWLASFTQAMMMFGFVVGVSIFGWISDRYGRRKAYLLTTSLAITFMIACSFSSNFWVFTVLRFVAGVGSGGIMTLSVIISMESFGPQHKDTVGSLSVFPDGCCQIIVTGIAYLCSTWETFLLVCGLTSIPLLLALFYVPDTPRWLIAQKRGDEAIEMMTKVAKFNKLRTEHIRDVVNKTLEEFENNKMEVEKLSYYDLFRTRKMTVTTIASIIVWFIGGISFYGINQYSSLISSNIYVVVPILGSVQVFGTLVSIVVNRYTERKAAIISSLLIIGASMFVIMFIPLGHWGCTVATAVGFTSSMAFFCFIYVQVNELYPTPLRNMGFGLSSAGAKFGATVAPFIANTKPYWLASSIFAGLCVFAVVACFFLPETKGKKLQDTVD